MREIKFRAWDKTRDIMIGIDYPNNWDNNKDEWYCDIDMMNLTGITKASKSNYLILMQYTGVKDKNGKEIYEGDIIEHIPKFETRYEIKFLTSGFYICPSGKNYGEYFSSLFAGYDEKTNICKSLEIIGNIYQNKELL